MPPSVDRTGYQPIATLVVGARAVPRTSLATTTLETARKNELVLYEMVRDGILFIEKNERAEFIEQDLMNYLTPELKSKYEELKFSREKGK